MLSTLLEMDYPLDYFPIENSIEVLQSNFFTNLLEIYSSQFLNRWSFY